MICKIARKRSLFRYYGGKHKIAPWINSFFPEHRTYVELFAGAASVLLRKKRSYSEVINDLNLDIINYYRILQDDIKRARLLELLKITPFAREEYDLAHIPCEEPIERARRLLIRSFMGFNADSVILSNSKSGFRNDCNRQWSTPAHNWSSYPEAVDLFAERLKGVVVENIDAFVLLDKWQKQDDYLWYLDPPYVHETRKSKVKHTYAFEMTTGQHDEMVKRLLEMKGMIILSGYSHRVYDPLLENGWIMKSKDYGNYNAANDSVTECLWINPQCINALNKGATE